MKTAGKSEAGAIEALRGEVLSQSIALAPVRSDLVAAQSDAAHLAALLEISEARATLAIAALEAIVAVPRVAPDPPSTFGLFDSVVAIAQAAIEDLVP